MMILKAEGLVKEWDGHRIFENVDLEVKDHSRLALIGANGVGKTTLLQGLIGKIALDGGRIYRKIPPSDWGLLEQDPETSENVTLLDFLEAGDPVRAEAKRELRYREKMMIRASQGEMSEAVDLYGIALDRYQALDGYKWEKELEQRALRFGLKEELWLTSFRRLSGGQKTRAQLARIMMQKPAFLLLDEPTNHLDEKTLSDLEVWLANYPGAVLFVSHDRVFIDCVAEETVELSQAGTKGYTGGYSSYITNRERERRTQAALFRKQQQERRKLEEAIRRYREWFNKAHAAAGERNPFYKKKANKNQTRFRAKEEALKRLESREVKRPQQEKTIPIRFGEKVLESRNIIQTENLSFHYGKRVLFDQVNLSLTRGDRLAVIGPNGSGKTTLLRLLTGKLQPCQGHVQRHPALSIGYFAQELEELDRKATVLDSVLRLPGITQGEARNILASFYFRGDDVFRQIKDLSMGEQCRVAFVRIYFSEANLLVLDEPTNYLDIPTRERMEEALKAYPGTMVIVSHDRYLLSKISSCVAVIQDGTIMYFPGGYEEYRQRHELKNWEQSDPDLANRIRELELKQTQLVGEERLVNPNDEKKRLKEIQRLTTELEMLKKEADCGGVDS